MTKMEIIYLILGANYLFTILYMYPKVLGYVSFLKLSLVCVFLSFILIPSIIVDSVLSLIDIRVYLRVLFIEDSEDSSVEWQNSSLK